MTTLELYSAIRGRFPDLSPEDFLVIICKMEAEGRIANIGGKYYRR